MSSPLIITKVLLPRPRSDLVYRSRLIDFIHAHIDRKLVLVLASAGYGKTSLLVSYAHDTELPVCWYSLDPSDNDPRLFLEYLVACVQQRFPDFGRRTLTLLRGSTGANLEPAVNAFINGVQERIPDDFVMILDDYQDVEENVQVNAILDRLLRYLPDNAHIILSSRTLPRQLPLTTLTAKRQTAGLGVGDLRFTPDEVKILAQRSYRVELTDEEAADLVARNEGWVTGILLTTHTIWQGLFRSWMGVQGTGSQVFEYLAGEVFQNQPEEIRRFLLATSVLREMTPALCDALLGLDGSETMLQVLEARNLFINRLDGPGQWFRYHALFREFLCQKLRSESPDLYHDLQTRAGRLAVAASRWDAAVDHFVEAGEFEQAAAVIEQVVADVYGRGQWRTLTRWMDMLPSQIMDRHPMLKLWRAKIHVEMSDLGRALQLFDEAYRGFLEADDVGRAARTLVERGSVLRLMGNHEGAIADCEAALAMGEHVDTTIVALAHRVIGTCYGLRGEFVAGANELEESLRLYQEAQDRENEAYLYHDLGTMYELIGDIDRSIGYFRRALRYWEEVERPWALANTLNSIGNTHYYRGEYAEAEEKLSSALEKAREAGYVRIEAYVLASLGDVYRDTGRVDDAARSYQDSLEIAQRVNDAMITVYSLAALGDVYRLLEQWDQAEELLQQAMSLAERHESGYEIGLCGLGLGMLACDMGRLDIAREYLERARTLFEEAGAQREWARAELQIAYLEFVAANEQRALEHVARALEIARRIGSNQPLLVDGSRLLPLYRYAVRRHVGGTRLRRVQALITHLQRKQGRPAVRTGARRAYLRAYALGTVRVVRNGRILERSDWKSVTTRELFFYLLEHQQPLRKEEIMEAFWPGFAESRANSNFHSTVYRLRKAMGQGILLYEDERYRLNPEIEIWYDVEAFEDAMSRLHRQAMPLEQQERLLEQALDLYHGDFLVDSYADWCVARRESLRELRIDALLRLAQIRAVRGDPEGAMELLKSALQLDDCREETYGLLMQVCASQGDRDGVIHWYHHCQDVLASELGVSPSPETTRLYRELVGM
ncbi:MAG: tetratricopeptide repeat protein [Anaerolineae bacterium]|nr:tetratricopeptide repeat protein [Anaerolineae bacterium]